MTDTIKHVKNGARVFSRVIQRLARGANVTTEVNKKTRGSIHRFKRRIWVAASADPMVDAGSQATYPVAIGDLAYRLDSDEVFICSRAPAAATAATFVQMHA